MQARTVTTEAEDRLGMELNQQTAFEAAFPSEELENFLTNFLAFENFINFRPHYKV